MFSKKDKTCSATGGGGGGGGRGGPDNIICLVFFSHLRISQWDGPSPGGSVPEFLRKPIANRDFPVGRGCLNPMSPLDWHMRTRVNTKKISKRYFRHTK